MVGSGALEMKGDDCSSGKQQTNKVMGDTYTCELFILSHQMRTEKLTQPSSPNLTKKFK